MGHGNAEYMGITSSNTHTIQANKQPKQSKWRPSRTPPTTSPSPSRAEVPKLRRRPTSKLLRTVMPASEPVPLLPRMPSQTRLINPPTRARLISTRRLLSLSCSPRINKHTSRLYDDGWNGGMIFFSGWMLGRWDGRESPELAEHRINCVDFIP